MMTKQEFGNELRQQLTPYQYGLYNFVFYCNPKYVEQVFMQYHLEEFEEVMDFVLANKDKLRMKNVPKKFKNAARMNVQAAKALQGQETATISI